MNSQISQYIVAVFDTSFYSSYFGKIFKITSSSLLRVSCKHISFHNTKNLNLFWMYVRETCGDMEPTLTALYPILTC